MSKKNNRKNKALKVLQKRKAYAEGGQQQLYARRKDSSGAYEDEDSYQDRVTTSQAADPNFNVTAYQNALRSGQGVAAVSGPADADYSFKPAPVKAASLKLKSEPAPPPVLPLAQKAQSTPVKTMASTSETPVLTGTRYDGNPYGSGTSGDKFEQGSEAAQQSLLKLKSRDVDTNNDNNISQDEWLSWMSFKGAAEGFEADYKAKLESARKKGIEEGTLSAKTLADVAFALGEEGPPVEMPGKPSPPELKPLTGTRYDGEPYGPGALKTFEDANVDKDGNRSISADEWLSWMVEKGVSPGFDSAGNTFEADYNRKLQDALNAGNIKDSTRRAAEKKLGIDPPADDAYLKIYNESTYGTDEGGKPLSSNDYKYMKLNGAVDSNGDGKFDRDDVARWRELPQEERDMARYSGWEGTKFGIDKTGNPLEQDAYDFMLTDGGNPTGEGGRFSPSDIAAYYAQEGKTGQDADDAAEEQRIADEAAEAKIIADREKFLEDERKTVTTTVQDNTLSQTEAWWNSRGNQALRAQQLKEPPVGFGMKFHNLLLSFEPIRIIGKSIEMATEAEKEEYWTKREELVKTYNSEIIETTLEANRKEEEDSKDPERPEEGYNTGPIDVENKRPEDPDVERAVGENAIDVAGSTIGKAQETLANPNSSLKAKEMARSILDNAAVSRDVQSLSTDEAGVTGPDISGGTTSATAGVATTVSDPADILRGSYTGVAAGDLGDTGAAVGDKPDSASAEGPSLSERAAAATRDAEQEKDAKQAVPGDLKPSDDSIVGEVNVGDSRVWLAREAEAADRKGITGREATNEQAKIIETTGFEAAERRIVTGTAAKEGASKMLEVVGKLPPTITANIVEDPAEVTAQIDSQPVEVRAAIAALPTEALVSSQMESLLAGIDEGKVPTWAKPAVAQVNDMMARRGLTTSTVGRDALFNAIIQTAMPMAQSNAQALQATAAQNLSNQQQANLAEATQSMQLRLTNLGNRQTAGSQTAQMAQQMKTMQSQFGQDAVMTTEQIQQQTRTQNLSNRQQAAQTDAQNTQAMAAQSLGNEQQIELANLQYANATESENMSAEQQGKMAQLQIAADYISKNAGFDQQMKLANLSNDQQMRLANLSALNQADSESMSAEQQTELANLNNRMQTNLTNGKISESLGIAQLNVDQQRAVTNATMYANIDLTKFNAEQQVAVANSKFMQTMALTDFNAEQQAAMQNATSLATIDLATADQNTKLAITNAQNFLNMDMANLSNKQQGVILDQQMDQQRLLSAQSATNASKQFNATSANQINQFNTSLAATILQFNKTQSNTMEQFNKSEKNKLAAIDSGNALQAATAEAQIEADVSKFNNQQDLQRETWNAANAQAVEQSNVQWRRQANTAGTAAANAANQQNVQNAYNMSALELTQLWQQIRDEATYIRQAYESNEGREAQLLATAIGNEGAMYKGRTKGVTTLVNIVKDFTGTGPTTESARGTYDIAGSGLGEGVG